jgi:release factor glutamine methyltransferase
MDAPADLAFLADEGALTISHAVRRLTACFKAGNFWGPSQDARALVSEATGLDFSSLVLRGDEVLRPDQRLALLDYATRRLRFEPVGRIIGRTYFRGLELDVSPATLEPREDTGVLVDAGLAFLALTEVRHPVVADLGTGTGAILVSVLAAVPDAYCVAVDISVDALATARRNAQRLRVADRFLPLIADYGAAFGAGRFDLILSNPPYIASDVIAALDPDVRDYDPRLALDGGADGLDAYRALAPQAFAALKPGGCLMVEIGYDQGDTAAAVIEAAGFADLELRRDGADRDRVIIARKRS